MNVIAYDPFLTEEKAKAMGIEFGTLDDVLEKADFITVHTPLLKDTYHLIDEDAFKKMKDGVRIINCARGGIIDEDALYDALVSGKVAGAALDVFENEPALDHKILELPNVIATPHLGASTVEAQESVAMTSAKISSAFYQADWRATLSTSRLCHATCCAKLNRISIYPKSSVCLSRTWAMKSSKK